MDDESDPMQGEQTPNKKRVAMPIKISRRRRCKPRRFEIFIDRSSNVRLPSRGFQTTRNYDLYIAQFAPDLRGLKISIPLSF